MIKTKCFTRNTDAGQFEMCSNACKFQEMFSVNKSDFGFCDQVKHKYDMKSNTPIQQIVSKMLKNVKD